MAISPEKVVEIGTTLAPLTDPDKFVQAVCHHFQADFSLIAHLWVLNPRSKKLVLKGQSDSASSILSDGRTEISLDEDTHFLITLLSEKEAKLIQGDNPSGLALDSNTQSALFIPLAVESKAPGILILQSPESGYFTDDARRLINMLINQINAMLIHMDVTRIAHEFLASKSHDLRSPLNSIIGYTEVMLDGIDGPINEDMEEDLTAIHESGKFLLSMINDLTDVAKMGARRFVLEVEDVSPGMVLGDLAKSPLKNALGQPVEFQVQFDDNLPTLPIDSYRLSQLLQHFALISCRFSDKKRASLVVTHEASNKRLKFEITGTEAITRQESFDIFRENFENALKTEHFFSSLEPDCAIAVGLIRLLDGTVNLETHPDKGMVFTIHLPVRAIS